MVLAPGASIRINTVYKIKSSLIFNFICEYSGFVKLLNYLSIQTFVHATTILFLHSILTKYSNCIFLPSILSDYHYNVFQFTVPSEISFCFCILVSLSERIQATTVNSVPSEFRKTVRIIQSAELTVLFNIGSQWSVSREIVRIKHSAELSG